MNQAVWFVNSENLVPTKPFGSIVRVMKDPAISRYLSKLGKKGGKARMDSLSAEERKRLARLAGVKSGEVRRAKAKSKPKGDTR